MQNNSNCNFDYQKSPLLKKKIIILGNGQLGSALSKQIENSIAISRSSLDLNEIDKIKSRLYQIVNGKDVFCIINATAYTDVEKAEQEKDICNNVNNLAIKEIASFCSEIGVLFIHFSTDFVFDGALKNPYKESDKTNPLNHYGKTKLLGEEVLLGMRDINYFIFRISWVYSAFHSNNFIYKIINALKSKDLVEVVDDQTSSPCNTFILAKVIDNLIKKMLTEEYLKFLKNDIKYGIYHISDNHYMTRYQMAKIIFEQMSSRGMINKYKKEIVPIDTKTNQTSAFRPKNSKLDGGLFIANFELELGDSLYHLNNGIDVMLGRIENWMM
jgi:dTDP-4-dehydrorhamnose reductase